MILFLIYWKNLKINGFTTNNIREYMLNTAKYLTYIFLFPEKYISLQYKTVTNNL